MTVPRITDEDFDRILRDLVDQEPASRLLAVSGVYEAVTNEFNNEVLAAWALENPEPEEEDDADV